MLSLLRRPRTRDVLQTHQRLADDISALRSSLLARIQRIENELMAAKLSRFFSELDAAIRLAVSQGVQAANAIEKSLRASVAALTRGKAGGFARARNAWRYDDGTFMPESEKVAAYAKEYERYAAGGRARAARAQRAEDGTFLGTG